MANPVHLEIIKKGVKTWNDWRKSISNELGQLDEIYFNANNLYQAESHIIELFETDMLEPTLSKIDLSGADLSGADLIGADLSGADLSKTKLIGADLSRADLFRTQLYKADLSGVDLIGADMRRAKLNEAKLVGANLSRADLSGAYLIKANLLKVNLSNVALNEARLDEAILIKANLYRTTLDRAYLFKTNLSEASLIGTNLTEAILFEANLSETDLNGAIFNLARLDGADLTNSILGHTVLTYTSLNNCKGMNTIKAQSECSVDFQTLKASKNLPKEFLLKIGLPENYIDYLPDFYDESPLRLFPVFISHSSKNKDFSSKLYDALIKKGVKVWYDKKKLRIGDDLYEEISKGINVYDKMILVCSKESLNESWWVNEEMNRIFNKERQYMKAKGERMQLLIPITLDDFVFSWQGGKAESLKDKVIGDFTEWQDENKFEEALNKLVEALNVDRNDGDVPSFLNLK